MKRRSETQARERRFQIAQLRSSNRRIAELEAQRAGLELELSAAIQYLRNHESRLAGCDSQLTVVERRLEGHEGELKWLRGAIENILNSRLWKAAGQIGQFARKITGRL
jgi:chromosome segregation ATPase